MTHLRAALVGLALLCLATPLAPAAPAYDCGDKVTSFIGKFYLVEEYLSVEPFGFTIWIYEETTGDENLQRGGETLLEGYPERCSHPDVPHDQAIL